jgi:hypothetical protein
MEIKVTREEYREMIKAQLLLQIIARKVEETDSPYIETLEIMNLLNATEDHHA